MSGVEDDGPGIPPDEREKVFRRLYRLERSRTSPGTGLGLSLVRAIADIHEAQVTLEDADPGLLAKVMFPRI
jgi:signal transduction histidine kinase